VQELVARVRAQLRGQARVCRHPAGVPRHLCRADAHRPAAAGRAGDPDPPAGGGRAGASPRPCVPASRRSWSERPTRPCSSRSWSSSRCTSSGTRR
jgi:hypothetical protein